MKIYHYLAAVLVAVAVALAGPAPASAHYPYESTSNSLVRSFINNSWRCSGTVIQCTFQSQTGWQVGLHSRQVNTWYRRQYVWGSRTCYVEFRVQQDGGPYVAQLRDGEYCL